MTQRPSKTTRHQKAAKGPMLSPKTRNAVLIGSGSLLVIVLGWWAYFTFTTITPPVLANAKEEDAPKIVKFLGDQRGFSRMTVENQEKFLVEAFNKFPQGTAREKFVESMNQMSPGEREVLQGAVFQIARKKVVAKAKEYAAASPSQRMGIVDNTLRDFGKFRAAVTGGGSSVGGGNFGGGKGGPSQDIPQPLKQDLPTSSDEMLKVVVSRTSAQERSTAEPFVNAMADRIKQTKGNDSLKQQLLGG